MLHEIKYYNIPIGSKNPFESKTKDALYQKSIEISMSICIFSMMLTFDLSQKINNLNS